MIRLAVVAALVGLWRWRTGTEWVLAGLGGPWLGLRAVGGVWAWQRARHRRELLRPLSAALAPYLGVPASEVEAGLSIPPGHADADGGEHVGSLRLPDEWAAQPDQKKAVEQVIEARLGIDVKWQWRTAGYPMTLVMTRAPVPPGMVPFASVRGLVEACPPEKILLGIASDGTPRYWDRSSEDPHVAIHGGSRRGKTSLLLLVAAQELRHGADLVTCIDPKRVSLTALAGCGPAVRLLNDPRDPAAMWEGVADFRALVEDRFDQLNDDPTREFARALLIIDEVSMCSAMWAAYWRTIKERADPAVPPVWADVAACVWLGAQANCHVIVAGQRLDYNLLGGMLGSFGVRLLAGYGPTDYARLVGIPPFLRSQKNRGRFLLYAGGELDFIQLAFGDPDELRGWVLAGREVPADLGAFTSPVSLRAAVAAGIIPGSLDAAKRARADDPAFPPAVAAEGQTKLYSPAALAAWQAARPRAGRQAVTEGQANG